MYYHVVYKSSSITTKVRAVFDASAKSSSGISLNDVGPIPLLWTTFSTPSGWYDVSKMYRAVELVPDDRDLHRFVWRSNQSEVLRDYRMTRVTFGVSASSFAANMCVKQNAIDCAGKYPLAAKAVEESFYVDDGLRQHRNGYQVTTTIARPFCFRRVFIAEVELEQPNSSEEH